MLQEKETKVKMKERMLTCQTCDKVENAVDPNTHEHFTFVKWVLKMVELKKENSYQWCPHEWSNNATYPGTHGARTHADVPHTCREDLRGENIDT